MRPGWDLNPDLIGFAYTASWEAGALAMGVTLGPCPPLLAIHVLDAGQVCAHALTRAGRGCVGSVHGDEGRASGLFHL